MLRLRFCLARQPYGARQNKITRPSWYNSYMPETAFDKKYLPHWLFAGGAALLLIFGSLWWTKVYEDPYNVYWGMLANSMATSSVTKQITQKTSTTNLQQYITLRFGTDTLAYGRTTLTNATGTVKTESVGTLKHDYVRYTDITAKQKKDSAQASAAKVLGKWAAAPVTNNGDTTKAAPFLLQSMLGLTGGNLVPMANIPAAARAKLVKQLHSSAVFDTDFSKVQRTKQNGRPVYIYDVSVEPVGYVGFEKAFAAALGIKLLDNVDPNNYQGQSAAKVQLSVDVRSHQLAGITYPGAQHKETFTSYGVPVQTQEPKASISTKELQTLIGKLQ